MPSTREIYLTKKYISKDEWLNLIKIISNYNGLFRKWKIIVINSKNQIRYFIESNYELPPTINNLNSFLLKPINGIKQPKYYLKSIFFPLIGKNIIDIINYCEIHNKKKLKSVEMNFIKISKNRIINSSSMFIRKGNILKKFFIPYSSPQSILSVDFEGNKRYFYKKIPSYLEIKKILHLLSSDKLSSILSVDTFPYFKDSFYINQNSYSFDKHSIILGSSGSGKSKFISTIIYNLYKNSYYKNNYKVVLIDPHASLEKDIGGIGEVIDFNSIENSINLFTNDTTDVVVSTEILLELFKSLINNQYNSKLERVLRYSINILLSDSLFRFQNLKKLLLDTEFRNNLINKLKNKISTCIIEFFLSDFNELKTKSYGESISPIISFIDEMELIPVFNEDNDKKDLNDIIKENFLTIFSLDRTKIGEKATKTISGLIMQQLLTIIQKRKINEHIIFIIDEVPLIENSILSRYLSESRKYNLSLILIGQYFNQISDNLKKSIFANAINYFIFRISQEDANELVDNINMKIPMNDTRETKIKLLTELNNRECIARIESNGILLPAFKGRTIDFKSIPRKEEKNHIYKNTSLKENKKINFVLSEINLKDVMKSTSTKKGELENE